MEFLEDVPELGFAQRITLTVGVWPANIHGDFHRQVLEIVGFC